MADRLTQLQDCLDDTKHSYAEIEGQPSQAPQPAESSAGNTTQLTNGAAAAAAAAAANSSESSPLPDPPETFSAALRELAQDLILKEQQVEHLINSLPGLGTSESDQERRMRELEAELRRVEAERERKEAEREAMIDILGQLIVKVKRVP